jgi:hypothetical protein
MIFPFSLYSHIDQLPILSSKTIKIYPFSLCVNIRAKKTIHLILRNGGSIKQRMSKIEITFQPLQANTFFLRGYKQIPNQINVWRLYILLLFT